MDLAVMIAIVRSADKDGGQRQTVLLAVIEYVKERESERQRESFLYNMRISGEPSEVLPEDLLPLSPIRTTAF
ncbi:hypothetical protein J6590_001081 [Homalodisca vitripennis]|nr:hypothetical protein J6590_001081 [Homalodisca vitripennis]